MTLYNVLQNVDILQVIVETLQPDDLAKLARTSRFVSDTALDLLWRILPTAFYALRLLPGLEVASSGMHVRPYVLHEIALSYWLS